MGVIGVVLYSERNLSQYHFFHHKPHIDWPGIEHVLLQREAAYCGTVLITKTSIHYI
jgi:hypothetical protein